MKVSVWAEAGGKHAFNDNTKRTKLIEGIAELIAKRPGERWLVVAHRHAKGQKPMYEALQNLCPGVNVAEEDPDAAVQVITWGRHMASNAFADIPNVILAGTLFMRGSHNTALTHLAQGKSVEHGFRPDDEVAAISKGEHAHHILQALCRGRVRQLDGERCKDMRAYIIASKRSGIADLLPTIFPGCEVGIWREDDRVPGKVAEAIAYLEQRTCERALKVTNGDIQAATGVSAKNFARLITKHDAWTDAVQRLGWRTYGGKRKMGLERADAPCPPSTGARHVAAEDSRTISL